MLQTRETKHVRHRQIRPREQDVCQGRRHAARSPAAHTQQTQRLNQGRPAFVVSVVGSFLQLNWIVQKKSRPIVHFIRYTYTILHSSAGFEL